MLLAAVAIAAFGFQQVAHPAAAWAKAAPCFTQVSEYTGSGVPAGSGIPPWGYHTGNPITWAGGDYSRAWGDINLNTGWMNGKICQALITNPAAPTVVVMQPQPPILFHTHYAIMYGYPGNEIKVHIVVTSSDDPNCAVGTVGLATFYASYNNVKEDLIKYKFPAACATQSHTYHGPQVVAQIPPL